MPHISKRKVNQKVFNEIYNSFAKAIAKNRHNYSAELFTSSFFTKTERIMFAKRLAIIALLHKGYPFYEVVDILKVSPSTVARFERNLMTGKYKALLKILGIKTKNEAFHDTIGKILRMGMPPIIGKGRLDGLNRY
jgi:uncharacterized protein YerC